MLQALQALVVARTGVAPATLDFRVNISDAMGVQQNAQASMACPSTPASQAAGMRVTTTAYASCDEVRAELAARVEGQGSTWHDPHNAGTYTKNWASDDGFSTSRLTGDGSNYIDHQVFTLAADGDSCKIMACSRSQSSSYGDYGTNYCNLSEDVVLRLCCRLQARAARLRHGARADRALRGGHGGAGRVSRAVD